MRCSSPRRKSVFSHGPFRVPYRVYGEGEDIICLNGIQQSMAMWFSFVQHFEKKYRITLFDFPYQGNNNNNNGSLNLSLDEQVSILKSLIEELGIEKSTICSASWGGVVALLFAVHFPDFVDRLILASIGMRPNAFMKDTILEGINADESDRERMAKIIINRFGGNLPEKIKLQITKQFKSMSGKRLKAFCEHGLSIVSAGPLNARVPLSQVEKNTVIIYGENDKIIDYADVEDLAFRMSDCTIKTIPSVGHFLHLEDKSIFGVYEEILEQNRIRDSISF
ncbi:MAG: alpha/beta fold hydrolase [Candidatus Omnitrophica bacterium]|nr:alpha/beta fold hydrolase [Candidatus Omnitrophota bacterium]MBD3269408.1 alpha/beta fold hydrolase [Candidatus Omnitrophota bacterium]